jgi:hypothetical protein
MPIRSQKPGTLTVSQAILATRIFMTRTNDQYDEALISCRLIFTQKAADYGTSWRVLRMISVVDQMYIKARRIRTIQELGRQRVGERIDNEFRGIVNYAVIGLIQIDLGSDSLEDMEASEVEEWFDRKAALARKIMQDKNHDYGEAWREMSQESFVDLILMKLVRIRQILANDGQTRVSEGIDSNLIDIINYSLFALIRIAEGNQPG